MAKIKYLVLTSGLFSLFFSWVFADTITLKSGKVIEGEIIEKNKDYIKVRYQGTEIYYENKYVKDIETKSSLDSVLEKSEEAYPQEYFSFKKGLELAASGKFTEAKLLYEKLLADSESALSLIKEVETGAVSKEFALFFFQGLLYLVKEEYASAKTALEKAWEIIPHDADVNYNLAFVNFVLEEYQKAKVYLFAVLKLRPDDTQAYELLANTYYNLGDAEKAKESLLIAQRIFTKSGEEQEVQRLERLLQLIAK